MAIRSGMPRPAGYFIRSVLSEREDVTVGKKAKKDPGYNRVID
jgi:hypothetical protein